jgi:hypothetical protein
MPKRRADIRTDMTPKKKETFSRVRTTLADCQEADSLVMRQESYRRHELDETEE